MFKQEPDLNTTVEKRIETVDKLSENRDISKKEVKRKWKRFSFS